MKSSIRARTVVTLHSYLASAIGFLAVARYIEPIYIAIFVILFGLSIYFEIKRYYLPRWFLNISSLLIVAIALVRISSDDLVIAIVETLLIFVCIKLMEDKKPRDHFQIYIISVFLIAGSALLTINISFVLYFIIFTFVFASGVIMLTYESESSNLEMDSKDILKILTSTAIFPVLAMPLTVFFFIFLPRTTYPFLNFLNREVARTGFTDSVRLGNISEIQEDNSVAFRASVARVGEGQLYWRGIVLDYFDGSTWHSTLRGAQGQPLTYPRKVIRQIIYLEPHEMNYLFGLDRPVFINLRGTKPLPAQMTEGHTFLSPEKVTRRIRYEVYSVLDSRGYYEIEKKKYLQLPQRTMTRVLEIARNLKGRDDEDTVQKIMNYLQHGYIYSLKGLPQSNSPLEDFLFTYRQGNCEYFASSMAVLLRLNGIPSRLIGGYKGGQYNDLVGYYVVSQRDAHVWVEAYINGKGWVRYDPTPPIRYVSRGTSHVHKDVLAKLRLALDTINYYWNALVITYDFSKQIALFNKVKNIKKPDINLKRITSHVTRLTFFLLILIIFVFLARAFLAYIKTPPQKRLLMRFERILKHHGYIRKDYQGLEEFVRGIGDPSLKAKATAFVREIEPYIFGPESINSVAKERLKNLIEDLK